VVGPATFELRQLRDVVEVAKERSFSRAGVNLHVVQRAVSHQVRVVETALGVQHSMPAPEMEERMPPVVD
jgi:Bacterial regulatory helix-turn-helix protein, lysR family